MKFSGVWVLLLFVVTSTGILSVSVCVIYAFSNADILSTKYGEDEAIITTSRNLKETGHGHVALDDYHPIDPVPSSKASIKPGPIEHGTPVQPFIPRPSPPTHPEVGGPT